MARDDAFTLAPGVVAPATLRVQGQPVLFAGADGPGGRVVLGGAYKRCEFYD